MKDVCESEASLAGCSAYHWREVDRGVVQLVGGISRPGFFICFDRLWSSNLLEEGLWSCVVHVCKCVCERERE